MFGVTRLSLTLALFGVFGLMVTVGCDSGDGDGDSDINVEVEWNVDLDMSAQASWEACVGNAGACTDDCCPQTFARVITTTEDISCEVQEAFGGYQLSFSIASTEESQPALFGENLIFDSLTANDTPVTRCDRFRATEYGTNYPTTSCVEVDASTALVGGECAVELHLSTRNTVAGSFKCLELPSSGEYFTSIYNGVPGAGEFQISGCRFTR
jgi:hypothetical protein